MTSVTIETPCRERAEAMISEAGFSITEVSGTVSEGELAKEYWSTVEGCYHFQEPDILKYCICYTNAAEDVAARLAALLLLRERAETLRGILRASYGWEQENDNQDNEEVTSDQVEQERQRILGRLAQGQRVKEYLDFRMEQLSHGGLFSLVWRNILVTLLRPPYAREKKLRERLAELTRQQNHYGEEKR